MHALDGFSFARIAVMRRGVRYDAILQRLGMRRRPLLPLLHLFSAAPMRSTLDAPNKSRGFELGDPFFVEVGMFPLVVEPKL